MSSDVAVNLSVSGREASVYAYGSGTHTITVTSPYGTDEFAVQAGRTVSRTLSGFSVPPPVADFLAMPTEGWDEYYTGEFVSLSTGWITDYLWEFGDGQTSTELAASHKYALPGVYTVTLRVSGPGGSDAMTKRDYIVVKDFDDYPYPDYIVSEPVQEAFDAALDAIEASQSPGLAPGDPVWCTEKPPSNWCSMVQHGGGGRILFGFRDATIDVNWDDRIDARNPSGNSDHKRDWFGDNLIIDGQDKNIRFRYNGRENCGQHESGAALRIHGNDNIVRNITWDRFPDGLHMRGGCVTS